MRRWILLLIALLVLGAVPAHAAKLIIEGESYIVSEGGKEVTYENPIVTLGSAKLHAKTLIYHKDTKKIEIFGNIVVTSSQTLLTAESGLFEVKAGQLLLYDATLYDQKNNAFITAKRLERLGENDFLVEEATVTLCDPNKKSWSFYSSSIHYEVENFAYGTNMLFYVYDVPVFYSPIFSWPTTTKRTSGFLSPSFTNQLSEGDPSRSFGYWLRVPYFWAIDEDQDLTFQLDFLQSRGTGLGLDYRYAFSKGVSGEFSGWGLEETQHQRVAAYEDFGILAIDPATGFPYGASKSPTRYQYEWKHRQNLWGGQFFIEQSQTSDNELKKEYFKSTNDLEVRFFSKIGVEYPWESGGVSLLARRQDTFLYQSIYDTSTDETTSQRVMPSLNLFQNWLQIGGSDLSINSRVQLSTYQRIYGWSGQNNELEVEALYPMQFDFLQVKPSLKSRLISLDSTYRYAPADPVDGTFTGGPAAVSYSVESFWMTTDFELFRIFNNQAGEGKSKLTIRPSWEMEWVKDQDQRAALELLPFGTALTGTQADYDLTEKFETLIFAKNLHTLGLEVLYQEKNSKTKEIEDKLRIQIRQRINLDRKASLAEIESSFLGPQVPEALQETSLGKSIMPLLLDLSYMPLDGFSGDLFYRYGFEESRLLENRVSLQAWNDYGDSISLAYHNNRKSYMDLDGATYRAGRKEITLDGELKLSQNLKVSMSSHWNLERDAAYLYGTPVNRIGRSLTASNFGVTYRYDCFDFYLSYGESLYNWELSGVEQEGLEKRVMLTVNLVGLTEGEGGVQTQWSRSVAP